MRREDFDSPEWLMVGFIACYLILVGCLVAIVVRSL